MPVYKDEIKGTYYVNASFVNVFGKRVYVTKRGFKTKSLAQKYERQALLEYTNVKKQPIKFDDLFNYYLEYKSHRLKPRSIYDYRRIYEKHIKPYFGEMYVDKIKIPHIEAWQDQILELGFANDYLDQIQYIVKSTLSFAVRKLQIDNSPFDHIDYVKNTNAKRKRMKFFTPEQYEVFRSVIDDELHLYVFDTLYWTGMRISELQARTWSDLDFDTNMLDIHSNWDNKNHQMTHTTKNYQDRVIYIPKHLMEELKTLYSKARNIDGFHNDFFIFGNQKPISHKTVENAKNRYIRKYNSTHDDQLPQIRIHDFRHSHVSYLANNGADVWDIAERLGHSREMVEKRYSHMFPDKRDKMKLFLD